MRHFGEADYDEVEAVIEEALVRSQVRGAASGR